MARVNASVRPYDTYRRTDSTETVALPTGTVGPRGVAPSSPRRTLSTLPYSIVLCLRSGEPALAHGGGQWRRR